MTESEIYLSRFSFTEIRARAVAGDPHAQCRLGLLYDKGEGVRQDDVEAVRWFRLAAEQGCPGGQYNLGVNYGAGKGVPKDDTEAVRWYRLAADQGNVRAQQILAVRYLKGRGVPRDSTEADRWFRLAAENKFPPGRRRKKLSERERAELARQRTERAKEAVRWWVLSVVFVVLALCTAFILF